MAQHSQPDRPYRPARHRTARAATTGVRRQAADGSQPAACGDAALARVDPRLDRLASKPDGATEPDMRKATRADLAIDPIGPDAKVIRDVLCFEQSRCRLHRLCCDPKGNRARRIDRRHAVAGDGGWRTVEFDWAASHAESPALGCGLPQHDLR